MRHDMSCDMTWHDMTHMTWYLAWQIWPVTCSVIRQDLIEHVKHKLMSNYVYCIFRWFLSSLPLGRKTANSGADPSRPPRDKGKVAFNWFWGVKSGFVWRVLLCWVGCFSKPPNVQPVFCQTRWLSKLKALTV